jgi:hypothetical protein
MNFRCNKPIGRQLFGKHAYTVQARVNAFILTQGLKGGLRELDRALDWVNLQLVIEA